MTQRVHTDHNTKLATNNNVPEKQKLKCFICDAIFQDNSELYKHRMLHGVVNTFKCNNCDFSSQHEHDLYIHNSTVHNKKYSHCSYCGEVFYEKGKLNDHIFYVHMKN